MLRIQKSFPLIFSLGIVALALSACQKYEEGPVLSLRSRESRVENAWKAATITRNGYDITLHYEKYEVDFKSGGGCKLYAKDSQTGVEVTDEKPKWALAANDLQLRLTYQNKDKKDSLYQFMDILRLSNDNLRLRYTVNGDTYTLNLVPR